jgi:hypothetical protein
MKLRKKEKEDKDKERERKWRIKEINREIVWTIKQ